MAKKSVAASSKKRVVTASKPKTLPKSVKAKSSGVRAPKPKQKAAKKPAGKQKAARPKPAPNTGTPPKRVATRKPLEVGAVVNGRTVKTMGGYTVAELAVQTGMTPNYLHRLSQGKKNPSLPLLQSLAQVTGKSLEEVVTWFPGTGSNRRGASKTPRGRAKREPTSVTMPVEAFPYGVHEVTPEEAAAEAYEALDSPILRRAGEPEIEIEDAVQIENDAQDRYDELMLEEV